MIRKNVQGQILTQSHRLRRQMLRNALACLGTAGALSAAALALPALALAQKPKPTSAADKVNGKINKPPAIPAPKPEKRVISIATTSLSSLPYLPLFVAQQKGFFAVQGLELEITEHQSAARAMQTVASGAADVVCGWLENTLSSGGRAMQLQSYVLMGRSPMMALGALAKPAGQIDTLDKLRGKKLGVIALSSPTHTVALAALRSAGLRPSDVGIVSVGSPASALAALRSGQIDALIHMDPLMQQLEQRGEINILADLRSPQATFQMLGIHVPSSCLSATPEFLQRFPGTAQASADAMLQALQWLQQASLRDVLALLPDGFGGMDAQLFVASFTQLREAFSTDGQCSQHELGNLWQAILAAEPTLRLEAINPARSSSNAWMQRSAARLRLL